MATLTRNSTDKSQLKLNGTAVVQAANGEGEAILEEMIKFSKGEKYTIPTKLNYTPNSKCWTNHKGKIVLFNIAENETLAVELVKNYLTGEQAKKAKTDVSATPLAGVLTTDNGTPLSLDKQPEEAEGTTKALKVDKK